MLSDQEQTIRLTNPILLEVQANQAWRVLYQLVAYSIPTQSKILVSMVKSEELLQLEEDTSIMLKMKLQVVKATATWLLLSKKRNLLQTKGQITSSTNNLQRLTIRTLSK